MGDCRICLEPGGERLCCMCRDYGHCECIMRACRARYMSTRDSRYLSMCDVCHIIYGAFRIELLKQEYELTENDITLVMLCMVVEDEGGNMPLPHDTTGFSPQAKYMFDLLNIRKYDKTGEATDEYLRAESPFRDQLLVDRFMLEAAEKYIRTGNARRGKQICQEVYERLGDVMTTRDPYKLMTICGLVGFLRHADSAFVLSLEPVRRNMVSVMGEFNDQTLDFDLSIIFAYINRNDYKSASTRLVSLIKRMREVREKHDGLTKRVTLWLARSYCELKRLDLAKPLILYLSKRKYPFTHKDIRCFTRAGLGLN